MSKSCSRVRFCLIFFQISKFLAIKLFGTSSKTKNKMSEYAMKSKTITTTIRYSPQPMTLTLYLKKILDYTPSVHTAKQTPFILVLSIRSRIACMWLNEMLTPCSSHTSRRHKGESSAFTLIPSSHYMRNLSAGIFGFYLRNFICLILYKHGNI